jgi:hypothetical protein
MRRNGLLAAFLLLLLPTSSTALQLHWSSGADTLSFISASRCTLVLQAESLEGRLPGEWRLLWLADSAGINLVAEELPAACESGTARISSLAPPESAADSAAHYVTASFCSEGTEATTIARWLLDQPGGSCGRLKVVALDPTDADSNRVLESNEVTYNRGVSGTYPPVVLRASRSHPSVELRIEAIGIGFGEASRVEISAPDTSWRLALDVTQQGDRRLTAVGRVAADLPPFVLNVSGSSGGLGIASLAADTASLLTIQPACTNEMKEINFVSHEDIQPKDFAMVASRDSFHVFYTRQDYNLRNNPQLDSKIIGHKRSRDLYNWDPDEHTMHSVEAGNGGSWDASHVWAPTIIKKPGDITYYMLYTGVDANDVQRIGVATSTDLNVWTQDSTSMYESSDVTWALAGTPEFRDPFVMPDPAGDGHYLLYFVTKSQDRGRYVVGVATTGVEDPGNLRAWTNTEPLWNTDFVHTGQTVIESPHAFKDPDDRWCLYYTGFNSTSDPAYVSFQTNDFGPADLDTTRWSVPDTLFAYLGGDQKVQFWHASEYYQWAPGYEYLMAFNDSEHSVDVSQISWHGAHSFVLTDSCPPRSSLDVTDESRAGGIELAVLGARPGRAPVSFRIHAPASMRAELAIFDLVGRRVRKLFDATLPAGATEMRWDGLGGRGELQRSGVYFARLSAGGHQRITKLVLLR